MESGTLFNLWRWPVAVLLGVATMSLAVVVAGLANWALRSIPHWALPLILPISVMSIPVSAVIAAINRRRRSKGGPRRGDVGARL